MLTVPAHVQLVVANPAMAASGSGLVELLGSWAWEDLRRIKAGGAGQVDGGCAILSGLGQAVAVGSEAVPDAGGRGCTALQVYVSA